MRARLDGRCARGGVADGRGRFPLPYDGSHAIFPSYSDGTPLDFLNYMARPTNDILTGTLDLLILKSLSWGPAHGYGIARWIEGATADVLAVGESTLYPALHRLEERGLIEAEWGTSENNRRAKYYTLTNAGRKTLRADVREWRRYAGAVLEALSATRLASD